MLTSLHQSKKKKSLITEQKGQHYIPNFSDPYKKVKWDKQACIYIHRAHTLSDGCVFMLRTV